MANLTHPGVYIQEFAPPAPIAGVGTSTPAFIGEAENGPIFQPTKITSWDRFVEAFGPHPVPRSYLWYAVRGFFENGGTVCYVVRVSEQGTDRGALTDRDQNIVADISAREPGPRGLSLTITETPATAVLPWAQLTEDASNSREVVVTRGHGARFWENDEVEVISAGPSTTTAVVEAVQPGRGTNGNDIIRLSVQVTNITGDVIRLAVPAGGKTLRITAFSDGVPPEVGSVLRLSSGGGTPLSVLVDGVQALGPDATGRVAYRVAIATAIQQLPTTELSVTRHQSIFRPSATVLGTSGNTVEVGLGRGTSFQPGDRVVGQVGTATVESVEPGDPSDPNARDAIVLDGQIASTNDTIALTLTGGTRTLRLAGFVESPGPVPGAILGLSPTIYAVVSGVQPEFFQDLDPDDRPRIRITHRVQLRAPLPAALPPDLGTVELQSFDLRISENGNAVATYSGLGWDAEHPANLVATLMSDPDRRVDLANVQTVSGPYPGGLPTLAPVPLSPPAGAAQTLGLSHYRRALAELARIDDVNLVSVPDATRLGNDAVALQQMVLDHCGELADRFAVLDAHQTYGDPLRDLPGHAAQLGEPRGFAALYYPWLRVAPASGSQPILVPPSGHLCGIYARSDERRGVFKAPANEVVQGVQGIQTRLTDADHGVLNLRGVNVIRVFGSGRPIVWGARTTATSTNWQYINVRRLFIFIEESIAEGIRWAVFEPNTTGLWKRLRRVLTEFLTEQWRQGALFGETVDQAFYVRIDETLNPPRQRKLGRLTIEIGLQPSYPAEFIVVRIGIWDGGSEIQES